MTRIGMRKVTWNICTSSGRPDYVPEVVSCQTPPGPVPLRREEGLALFEPFLGFADSTVQNPGLPIRLQVCVQTCDLH